MSATQAFNKIRGKFPNRILRELNQNFDIQIFWNKKSS